MVHKGFRLLFVLWAGSLWSLAAWVAPTLFYAQGDRHLAGVLAARLFSIETYVGLGVAALALMLHGGKQFAGGFVAAALLAVNEWVMRPLMAEAHARGSVLALSFGAWHGVSALIYAAACVAVAMLVWRDQPRALDMHSDLGG
jgi:hypothetical protein